MSLWEIDLPDDLLCWQDSGFHMMPEVLDLGGFPRILGAFFREFFEEISREFSGDFIFTWEGDEFGGEMDPL